MRVVVKIPIHAYAELVAELERIPPRERAERVRLLASIGLTLVTHSTNPVGHAGEAYFGQPEVPKSSAGVGFHKIRNRLKEMS